MEQNLISHQSNGQKNKSKGCDIQRGLQVLLLIALCIWLLHQIRISHHNHNAKINLSISENHKPTNQRNATNGYLGRKAMVEYARKAEDQKQVSHSEINGNKELDGQTEMLSADHRDNGEDVVDQTFLDENGIPPDASNYLISSGAAADDYNTIKRPADTPFFTS